MPRVSKKKAKKAGENLKEGGDENRVHPDVRRTVWVVIFLGVSALFILAGAGQAGPWGESIYGVLNKAFGWGYYLLPAVSFILAFSLIPPERKRFVGLTLIAGLFFIASGLGVIDIISPGSGGLAGMLLGALKNPFGFTASLLMTLIVFIVSFLVILNRPLRVPKVTKKEKADLSGVDIKEVVPEPERVEESRKEEPVEEESILMGLTGSSKKGSSFSVEKTKIRNYIPPPLKLLSSSLEKPTVGDLRANANIIKRTLDSFGVPVDMGEINVGPTVTRYTLKPAEGVKLARITALNQDLALALAAHPVRVEAPIPGKSLVGIEVPNKAAALVRLGSLLVYPEFQKASSVAFALGRNVSGEPIFADIAKMPHLLIAGATGSGKTCGADTYVFSEKGMLTFRELCSLPLNSEKDLRVRVATRDGVETTSKNYNNGICDFYRLEAEEGYHIDVTAEHPLWVLNESGEMHWKTGGEIRTGDYVAISRGSRLFGKLRSLDFRPSPNKTNKARLIKIPTEITPALGLFLGFLAADGGLTIGNNRVVYTQAAPDLLQTYQTLLKDLFGISAPIIRKSGRSNKAKDIVVHSKQLKDFLSYLGLKAVGAREKEIPIAVRKAQPQIIRAFLQGLIRNDGHVGTNQLEITLASFKLLEQLQIVLLNFGIVSSLKRKKVKSYPDRDYWRLSVYGEELLKYSREVSFLTKEEWAKAERLAKFKRNPNKNVVPHVSLLLRNLGKYYLTAFARLTNIGWQYRPGVLVPKYTFNSLRSYNSGARNPSYVALSRILEFYSPLSELKEYQHLQTITQKNFYWAKVVKISRARGEGYDFEVPGSNSFVGNGFVNHNSVAIHSLLISLLYKNSPEMLRLILIDPKRVELSTYENLPHLMSPVVTDNKKAMGVLRWAISEMERRYEVLLQAGVRDIKGYNQRSEKLPYLLIVIDELADLMSSYGREVEGSIIRLAQMSRATGIHLVVSTQRPSVEVITGLIKANITSRIALQVASQVDSRTILDTAGAEKLLGNGDLLFISSEFSKPRRIQGAYITEDEVKKVTSFIKSNNKLEEDEDEAVEFRDEEKPESSINLDDYENDDVFDELYKDAVLVVREAKKASASLLQRRLKIGYARAARLLDIMEEKGVVGPGEGAKPRKVF